MASTQAYRVMSRRRSARLQSRSSDTDDYDDDQPVPATFDERLAFLREDDDTERPLRRRFEHQVSGATGPVEVVYWPAKGKGKKPSAPEQLTLFVLGELSQIS